MTYTGLALLYSFCQSHSPGSTPILALIYWSPGIIHIFVSPFPENRKEGPNLPWALLKMSLFQLAPVEHSATTTSLPIAMAAP
jgi:hypothetical protein